MFYTKLLRIQSANIFEELKKSQIALGTKKVSLESFLRRSLKFVLKIKHILELCDAIGKIIETNPMSSLADVAS